MFGVYAALFIVLQLEFCFLKFRYENQTHENRDIIPASENKLRDLPEC